MTMNKLMQIIEAEARQKASYTKGRWNGGVGKIWVHRNAITVEVEGTDVVGEVDEKFGDDVVDTLRKVAEKVRKDSGMGIDWDDVPWERAGELEKGSLFVQFWVWKQGTKRLSDPASMTDADSVKVLEVMEKVVKADGWKWSKEEF